ncbi:MAG: PQQ-dependent sugar dehydrogenase [Nitrospirae bacterium]|nr:PQQ-dependent sugar dehydrogenase [Nitrospirota bacterium]
MPPLTSGLAGTPDVPNSSLVGTPDIPNSSIDLQVVVKHRFSKPIFLTPSPDKTNRLFAVEQNGYILILHGGTVLPTPFLDISGKLSTGGEKGLLGLAFHPVFASNGRFFVNYTRAEDRATVIAEYHVSSNPNQAMKKETILLIIPQPYRNHNGGMIAFGPDGYLYIGMGDGGKRGDPKNFAQNQHELLGKFLRIDVDRQRPYAIPADNPFLKEQGQPEIFAWGLRNPWRFSFDRKTGDLWAGDVGQKKWEEIDVIQKGKNYGWRFLEGTHCYNPKTNCRKASNLVDPVIEYGHSSGRCSVTGGYVYRGTEIPHLNGTYFFGDYCSGEIWGYRDGKTQLLLDTDLNIASFGEDLAGELYVVGHKGKIYQISRKSHESKD